MGRVLALAALFMAMISGGAQAGPGGAALGWFQSANPGGGMSVARVAEVMRENGFSVEIGEDGASDPVIYSEAAGLNFALFGFNCAGTTNVCNEFLFSTYFDLENAPNLETINAFNEKALAGRAFIDDEGDANLEHLFTVASDDKDLIERNLAIWEATMLDFAEHLDTSQTGA